jgi:hypothetical protein
MSRLTNPTASAAETSKIRALPNRLVNAAAASERPPHSPNSVPSNPGTTGALTGPQDMEPARYQTTPVTNSAPEARWKLPDRLQAVVRNQIWAGRHRLRAARVVTTGRWAAATVIGVGFVSSLLVVAGMVLHKPYQPGNVANEMNNVPGKTLVVMADQNNQDVALGLSYALALKDKGRPDFAFTFLSRSGGYDRVFQKLALFAPIPGLKNLWLLGPGLRQREFPPQLRVATTVCDQVPDRYNRVGIPYQGYRCKS